MLTLLLLLPVLPDIRVALRPEDVVGDAVRGILNVCALDLESTVLIDRQDLASRHPDDVRLDHYLNHCFNKIQSQTPNTNSKDITPHRLNCLGNLVAFNQLNVFARAGLVRVPDDPARGNLSPALKICVVFLNFELLRRGFDVSSFTKIDGIDQ